MGERLFLTSSRFVLHVMAFAAIILNREGVFAFIVAGAARLAVFHLAHGGFVCAGLECENFGVAIGTFVCLSMEIMAENGFTY